jgi:hypothetical protein
MFASRCLLVYVAISGEKNVVKKETEKILKYKNLVIETHRTCNVKINVIPVIIGANGTVSKYIRKYLSNIPGNHKVTKLNKNSHTGHCTHTSESTYVKVQDI